MFNVKRIGPFIVEVLEKEKNNIPFRYSSRYLRKVHTTKIENDYPLFVKKLSLIIAILFMIGSSCFFIAPILNIYFLSDIPLSTVNIIYFIGSIFFTSASFIQYLQAINADISNKNHISKDKRKWIWFGFRFKNLGILSSFIQFIGTLLFNINTYNGTLKDLTSHLTKVLISTPDIIGSICFLLASFFAWLEVYHDFNMKSFRSVLWWIIWFNILGSIFFQISAIYGLFAIRNTSFSLYAIYLTMFGGFTFFISSYLLIPETSLDISLDLQKSAKLV